ncbi:MAG: hypothetical protein FJ296_06790, partial [Planctomycetes bacterium]|nr:hypothetical protein [Planctomycetota bacterium]
MTFLPHRRLARCAAASLLALLLLPTAVRAQVTANPGSGPGAVGGGPSGPSVFEPSGGGQYMPP